jgi:adenylate cyclase
VRRISNLSGRLFSGEERTLSIMFADIRGFSTISEKLSPQKIVQLLNRYFTTMTAIIKKRSGTVDKFIGDSVMSFWNAPTHVHAHQKVAVQAALDMQESLVRLNDEIRPEFGVDIDMGISVHCGATYVGNIGSKGTINYTIIGDSVNIASRLERLCKRYGVGILVSDDVRQACGSEFVFRYIDATNLRGKKNPVRVYSPMRKKDAAAVKDELAAWDSAMSFYTKGDFTAALEIFDRLLSERPDSVLYQTFSARAGKLIVDPPLDWSGVWASDAR